MWSKRPIAVSVNFQGYGGYMTKRATLALIAAMGVAIPASAIDIGKALQRPVTGHLQSAKGIYDLERCIVLLDGPGVPVVYRQPDRPDEEMIAYTESGMVVVNVVTLKRVNSITNIELRANHGTFSGVLAKAPSAFESCL